ncbi:beta-amyrin 28-monooxygenase [Ziziphus jujuba]|uniref:Beta-amyrin 28-monooxygenase n=1 Tax=Ziziphus jujuba TaxID=326968 RepID=A0ABM3IL39_ZIZJJ|nr:beta-amyrin 28-monooxygenase [Ziziphus jujuba]
MELIIVSIVLLATLYFLYSVLNSGSSSSTKNGKQQLPLPPGAKGWPLVGETLAYLQGSKKGVPEKFIAERRDKFSTTIFKSPLLNENMVFFCTAEGNKFLFANENKLVKSWWPKTFEKIFAPSEKTTQGEETMRMRKVLSPFLKPDSLQKYIGVMDSETQKHLKTYWDAKEVTVYPLAKKYTFAVGCKLFLNIDNPETIAMLEEPIRHISSGFVSSFPVNIPGTKYHKAIQAAKKIRTDIKHLVAQRRRDILEGRAPKSPDILSHLLMETYENGELINDSDIANKIYGLLHGAYDNVSALLSSIIAYLAELPEVYDRVRSEQIEIAKSKAPGELLNWTDLQRMKYSWNVACEVMRLVPPTQGTFREVITDFVYDGFLVPKGFKIHWNAFATHKNPKYFPSPEKFDPSRFEGEGPVPFSYVPFGGGPRMCPGKEYARLKILVFMHNMVKAFKWEKVFPDEKITTDPVSAPSKGLPVRLHPYK